MKGTVLFIIVLITFLVYSCSNNFSYEKKWKKMYESGNYKELISEASMYKDNILVTAYVILAKMKLKDFDSIELRDSEDAFFINVKNFLEWRECVFDEDRANNCGLKYTDGSSLKVPSNFLKEIFDAYVGLPIEELRSNLSKAYSKMKEISISIKNDLSQSELIKLKGTLNELYDSEIYRLPDNDIRKRMYVRLINEIDEKLKMVSVGIDRPQN